MQSTQQTQTAEGQPYLGVRLEDTADGVIVREVVADSPAATAGLQPDDIIRKINSSAIANLSEVASTLADLQPDTHITLNISRADHDMNLTATLGTMPTVTRPVLPTDQPFDAFAYMSSDQSWQVFSIAEASPLYTAGLRAGDTITKFNDTAYDPAGLRTYREGLASDATVKITLQRNGNSMDVNVPASDFKLLRLFGYESEGLLFNIPAQGVTIPTSAELPDQMPFDAFGYGSAHSSWQVFGLAEDSALYEAGLRTGDTISTINGEPRNPVSLRTLREGIADDAALTLEIQRGDQTMQISAYGADLNILALFANRDNGMLFGLPESRSRVWLGADILPLNSQVAQARNVTAEQGALVLGVMPDSPAASAGLQLNDIITTVGEHEVDSTHSLSSLLSEYKPGDQITLNVLRGSSHVEVEATLGQPEVSGELPALIGAF